MVRLHVDADVQVAGFSAVAAHVSLARNAHARAVGKTGGDVEGGRVAPCFGLLAVATGTRRSPLPAAAAALSARTRKDHVSARTPDRSRAEAVRAARLRDVQPATAA